MPSSSRSSGSFPVRLQGAHSFIEVGMVACTTAAPISGLVPRVVMLTAADGRPLISVDNLPARHDAVRLAYFEHLWRRDPQLCELRAWHGAGDAPLALQPAPVTAPADAEPTRQRRELRTGTPGHVVALPILALSQLIGAIRCRAVEPTAVTAHHELTLHVAVRLAQLGINPTPDQELARLTPRQLEATRLAARGHTNAEIAELLGMSENTVKKHIKHIYERLDLANRAELAARLAQRLHREDAPDGISRIGTCTVTKAAR
jgi:DNA-binding CsgD family transcriptional regulator